jgi:hypothetical protein
MLRPLTPAPMMIKSQVGEREALSVFLVILQDSWRQMEKMEAGMNISQTVPGSLAGFCLKLKS